MRPCPVPWLLRAATRTERAGHPWQDGTYVMAGEPRACRLTCRLESGPSGESSNQHGHKSQSNMARRGAQECAG